MLNLLVEIINWISNSQTVTRFHVHTTNGCIWDRSNVNIFAYVSKMGSWIQEKSQWGRQRSWRAWNYEHFHKACVRNLQLKAPLFRRSGISEKSLFVYGVMNINRLWRPRMKTHPVVRRARQPAADVIQHYILLCLHINAKLSLYRILSCTNLGPPPERGHSSA